MASGSGTSFSTPLSDAQCAALARGDADACDGAAICSGCLTAKGCMIDESGACGSVANGAYNATHDYLVGVARDLTLPAALSSNAAAVATRQAWQFRTGNATYCSIAYASVCGECLRQRFYVSAALEASPDSRFCRGENGCVCVFNCHFGARPGCSSGSSSSAPTTTYATEWYATTSPPATTTPAPYAALSSSSRHLWNSYSMGVGVFVVIVVIGICKSIRERRRMRVDHDGFITAVDVAPSGRYRANDGFHGGVVNTCVPRTVPQAVLVSQAPAWVAGQPQPPPGTIVSVTPPGYQPASQPEYAPTAAMVTVQLGSEPHGWEPQQHAQLLVEYRRLDGGGDGFGSVVRRH